MAHYRSTFLLFACIAYLGAAFSPNADGGQQAINLSDRDFSSEIAQANSPSDDRPNSNTPKPSPKADRSKSQPSQTKKTNSKDSKSISKLIVMLSRQRGLLTLGFAAVVITAAAVFIMLKLVDSDESNNSKQRRGRVERHKPRNTQFPNPDTQTNFNESRRGVSFGTGKPQSALTHSSDFSKVYNLDSGESEETGVEGDRINSDILSVENNTNGLYSDTDFNVSQKNHLADSNGFLSKDIFIPKDDRSKLDIIEALIEDLQQLNPVQRRKAIWELGQQGDSRAVEPLLDLLANSDSKQYSLVLASLSEIGIRTLKPMNNAWSISLQNQNPEVRKNAIRDLTRIYELVSQITHLLHRATDDPDPEVQETARWAINQLNCIHPRSTRD
ncbi:HEAT repeat domain-containing protein [Tychonema sp. BBK16]|uniref:HEAT repeat domain-containing protein n=1 Tax=Tychonema sp. BBK16 TaxID=2699888 RepID=UPI001F1CA7A0|nr:HEAT repeat domain-containing protein [Tychonema sp. BBK16]MCF6372654.1 HEAT repeat domain-containing protein [Tychonema sp. BBK16]